MSSKCEKCKCNLKGDEANGACSTGIGCIACWDCVCPDCHRCKHKHCKCDEEEEEEEEEEGEEEDKLKLFEINNFNL